MIKSTEIGQMVKGATRLAEKVFKKQLNTVRDGSTKKMNTFGLLQSSIKGKLETSGTGSIFLTIEGLKYGEMMDKGIFDVPHTPGSGVKKESDYIKALALWCEKKFKKNRRDALFMAFNIAKKRKLEQGSAPANPGWIKEIKEDVDKQLTAEFQENVMIAIFTDVMKSLDRKI